MLERYMCKLFMQIIVDSLKWSIFLYIKIRRMIFFQTDLKKDWFLFFILIWKMILFQTDLKKDWFFFFILTWKMTLFQTNLKKDWFLFFILIEKKNDISNHVWLFMIYIIIYMTSEWTHRFFFLIHRFLKWDHRFFSLIHRFLKWEIIAFWDETSSLFEMRHHRFFFLIHFEHHITFYNIYNYWCVSLSYASDDMQRNFLSVWKKSKTILWSRRSETWWKWWIEKSKTWSK